MGNDDFSRIWSLFSERTWIIGHITPVAALNSQELKNADGSHSSLAGIFAAKEAVIKCLSNIQNLNWKNIEISKSKSGRPSVNILKEIPFLKNIDISISHDGEYAIATAVAIIEMEK